MKVVKFGGSSLATAAQVAKVCDIIADDPARRLVVVSAPGKRHNADIKVTDLLIAMGQARLQNQSGEAELAEVIERYREIAVGLGLSPTAIQPIEADLRARLEMPRDNPGLYIDTLKAGGEDNCARLVALILQHRGVDAHYIDPKDAGMLLSDEPGNAQVLPKAYAQLSKLRERQGVTIFPGFFGASENGHVVTLPRGGSDITGAILARALQAEVYENFTDVDCVFAANPSIVPNPVPITEITYREMRELAYAGFSVFHDEALEPVFRADVPVNVRNTNNSTAPGTRIVPKRKPNGNPVVGIAAMAGFCCVYVSKYLMNRQIGFGRRLLEIFEKGGISFEHSPSGIDNMSILIREPLMPPEKERKVVQQIRDELAVDDVFVERGLALIMVVGEGMRHSIGLSARATRAFAQARVNIEMINQGSSEVSMMFGVKAQDMEPAVKSLYREFFG